MKNYPNFLGIGSVRGGSSWLWHLLKSHPSFYVPSKRKEIQFFTRFYDKGEQWYLKLFNSQNINQPYRGEFTPGYLTATRAPERIKDLECVEKFILILRNPVDRAYSHYKWHLRVTGKYLDFKTFCKNLPRLAIENSMYFKYLSKYLEYFEKNQFLILIYEEATSNPRKATKQLGSFFDVEETLFVIPSKKNQSLIPKHKKLFNQAHRITQYLRRKDLDLIPNILIRAGLKDLFEKEDNNPIPKLSIQEQTELYEIFKNDIENLEILLNRDLNIWTNNYKRKL